MLAQYLSSAKYHDVQMEDIVNYQEVRDKIAGILAGLRDTPNRYRFQIVDSKSHNVRKHGT